MPDTFSNRYKTSGVGFVNRYKTGDPPASDEEKLLRQIEGQRQDLDSLGVEQPKKKGPSVVSRIFDVLSRGNYASANTVNSILNDTKHLFTGTPVGQKKFTAVDLVRDAAREGWEGFSGKDKITYSKVLENQGVTGDDIGSKILRGFGGFALDVGLDPTTYITFGTSAESKLLGKGASEAAKAAEAANASSKLLKGGLEVEKATAAGRAAAQAAKELSPTVGKKVTDEILEKFVSRGLTDTATEFTAAELKKISNRVVADAAVEAGMKAGDDVLRNTARTFDIKFAGRPVVKSEKLYSVGSKLNEAFKSTEIGQGIQKTFSTKYKLPGRIHTFKREVEGYSHAQFEDLTKAVRQTFKGISNEDKRLISDAIEQGKDLSGILGKSGKDLGDLQRAAMDYMDSITQTELGRGIIHEDELLDNYVYHHYKGTDRDAVDLFKKERAKVQNPKKVSKATTIKSLEDAEKLGLKPVREIDDTILLRAGKSYAEQARVGLADAIKNEFGVKFGKNQKSIAKKLDLIEADGKYMKGSDVYLPKEVHAAVRQLDKIYSNPNEVNNLLTLFDKGLAQWKFGATAINPGHHIRNAVGDMFMNSLDGVTNPLRYEQAARVMNEGKGSIKVGDGLLSAEEVRKLFKLKGGKSGYTRVEIGVRRFGATEKIRELAESREDFTRMAHFIDALKKEGKHLKNPNSIASKTALDEAASRAAARVRKWNLDYGDLTKVEQKIFKRVAPFYTWMRKNVPLQIEAMALTPGRIAKVPKALEMTKQLLGQDVEFPTIGGLDTVPSYIRDMASVRIVGEGEGRNGVYFDPSAIVPTFDALHDVGEPLNKLAHGDVGGATESISKTLLNQMNPVLKAGVEFGTGKSVFTGADRDSTGNYFQNQLPAARLLNKYLQGNAKTTDLINYGTGASLRSVGEPQRLGEYRRQQDSIEGAREAAIQHLVDLQLKEDPNADPNVVRYQILKNLTNLRYANEQERNNRVRENMNTFTSGQWDM